VYKDAITVLRGPQETDGVEENLSGSASSRHVLTDLPWGSHVCHFYAATDDLLDLVVPYLAEGLLSNERCFWGLADEMTVERAIAALRAVVPELDRHLARGSLDVRRYDQFYLHEGPFDPKAMAHGWKPVLEQALADGYEGIRATGSTSWLSKDEWPGFSEYEKEFNDSLNGASVKAMCSYRLQSCGPLELLEAARTHPLVVARRDGDFELIPTSFAVDVKGASSKSQAHDEVVPEGEWRQRERANILAAMRRSKGRIYGRGGAAELLALKPSTLQSRIRAFGIRPGEAGQDN